MSVYLSCADSHCDNIAVCTLFCHEHQDHMGHVDEFKDFVLWDLWNLIEFDPNIFETLMSMVATVQCGRCCKKNGFFVCDMCEIGVPEINMHSKFRNRVFCLFGSSEETTLAIISSASINAASQMLEDPVVYDQFARAVGTATENLGGSQMKSYMRMNKSKISTEGPLSKIMRLPLETYFGKNGMSKTSKIYKINQAYSKKHFDLVF